MQMPSIHVSHNPVVLFVAQCTSATPQIAKCSDAWYARGTTKVQRDGMVVSVGKGICELLI